MRLLPRLGCDNALMTFDGRPRHTPTFAELLRIAKDHDARLVIIDTLADVFAGNENERGQARTFAQAALGLLARETQGAVLVLAHPSRAGMNSGSGESGSTAWVGTFRSQVYLATPKTEQGEPPDPDLRVLTRRKSNATRRDETIELRWEDGVFVAKHLWPAFWGQSSGAPPNGSSWNCSPRRQPNNNPSLRTRRPAITLPGCSPPGRIVNASERSISSAPCNPFSPEVRSPTRTTDARATCARASSTDGAKRRSNDAATVCVGCS